MALRGVPWAVGGGAHNPVEGARLSLYAATSGGRGVVGPSDMRVSALPVPGPAVRVHAGAAVMPNTYAGGGGQSYAVAEEDYTDFPIPATGSSGGATRYLVARISDPQYSGGTPVSVEDGPYNSYEWLSVDPRENPPSYPWVLLARVNQPANTATITQAMITDLRQVAVPRVEDVWRPRALVTADTETLTVTTEVGEYFPNSGGPQSIYIPGWATRALIRVEWLDVRYGAGNAWGQKWLEFGPYAGPSQRERSTQKYQFDTPAADNVSRANWIVVDDVAIPAAYRGTTQLFVPKARRIGGVTNSIQVDALSGMNLQVRFLEVADPSTT